MLDQSAETGAVMAAMVASTGLRVLGPVGNSRKRRPERLELGPLLVIQLAIEAIQGSMHRLHRVQHGIEPVGDGFAPCRRGNGLRALAGVLEQVLRVCIGLLERFKAGTLRVVHLKPCFNFGSRPASYAG